MTATRAIAIFISLAAFYWAGSILIPLVSALFLALLLDPAVGFLENRGVHRALGAAGVVLGTMAIIGSLSWALYESALDLSDEIPLYTIKIQKAFSNVEKKAERLERNTNQLINPVSKEATTVPKVQVIATERKWPQFLMRGIGSLFNALTMAVFIPVLVLFFLMEKTELLRGFQPLIESSLDFKAMAQQLKGMVRGYFLGNILLGISVGAAQAFLFKMLGLHNYLSLGFVTGFLNLIPLFGILLALPLPLAQALLQFNTAGPYFWISGGLLFFHLLAGDLIVPIVIGARVNISSTAATVGLLIWGLLWGPIGFLLGVPLTAATRILLLSNPKTAPWGNMLTAKPLNPKNLLHRRLLSALRIRRASHRGDMPA